MDIKPVPPQTPPPPPKDDDDDDVDLFADTKLDE